MKTEYLELPLVKNTEENHFELQVGTDTAFIEYKEKGRKIWLIHTESPEALQGKGAATAVIEKTLAYLEQEGYQLIPLCPLVATYLQRHTDWNRILDDSVKPF